jgi:hypothetical protein
MANLTGRQLFSRRIANEGVRFLFGLLSAEIHPVLAPGPLGDAPRAGGPNIYADDALRP